MTEKRLYELAKMGAYENFAKRCEIFDRCKTEFALKQKEKAWEEVEEIKRIAREKGFNI